MASIIIPAQGWSPRPYQLPLVQYMMQDKRGLRALVAWHRRAGKDITSINIVNMKALQRRGLYLYIGPFNNQIRRIIWQGQDGQGQKFLDYIPKELVTRKSEQEMSLTLSNGSVIQLLGADNPEKLVGINPVGIVYSEFSLCDPEAWKLTSPILAENGGWALFNGTPKGQNHFYHMLLRGQANSLWYISHLSAIDTKAMTSEELRHARDEQNDEALFQSEFMCSFNTPVVGAYYGELMSRLYKKGQIIETLSPEPLLPLNTAWDLGMDDSMSIWFYQLHRNEVRLLKYYENTQEGFPHYARVIQNYIDLHDLTYNHSYMPHDVAVKEMGTGRSRFEQAKALGLKPKKVKKLSVQDGREAVRSILPTCWFHRPECALGIEHLKGYHKEFDEQKQVYKEQHIKDQATHGADAFRTMAVATKTLRSMELNPRKQIHNEYREQAVSF